MLKIEDILKVLCTTMLMIALASCNRSSGSSSNLDDVNPDGSEDSNTLRDTEIIFSTSTLNMSDSKAGYSSDNTPNEFEINIKSYDSQYSYSDIGMSYDKDSNTWISTTPMYWADDTTPIEIEAFVPYKFTDSNYTIQSNQSSTEMLEACDLLYYNNTSVMPTSEAVPITFEHIMTKVYFQIELSNTGSYVDLSSNPITNSVIVGSLTTADISDPYNIEPVPSMIGVSITPYTTSSGITDIGKEYYTSTDTSLTAYYEAIFVPQTINSGELSMSLLVNADKAEWSSSENYTFEGGKIYVITLNLALSVNGSTPDGDVAQMQLSSFKCSDWYSGENLTVEALPVE